MHFNDSSLILTIGCQRLVLKVQTSPQAPSNLKLLTEIVYFYIFGDGKTGVLVFRILFVVFVFIGAVSKLTPVLNFSDAVFGLLAIPNLICNFLLRGKLDESLKEYESDLREGKV